MSAFCELLGNTLLTKSGELSTADALKDKTAVGIYFSAHWCPPCRGFTPKLAEWYTNDLKAKNFEVVFVSSDRDEESFSSYYSEQPWLALPYSARDLKNALSKKFKVNGIPSFVILDGATAELITKDGRSAVSEDPKGTNFPWRPPTLWEALGDEFLKGADGETVDLKGLKASKYIGLYFSAHWCPPCQRFTPKLAEAYKEHLKGKGCEIVFVSSDNSQGEFQEYYATMPWLAIPQGDPRKKALSSMFEVEGIPTLVIIDTATGETITTDGTSDLGGDPKCESFPWVPPTLKNLSIGQGVDKLNEELSLLVLLDGVKDEAAQKQVKATLETIAESHKAAGKSTVFFYAPTSDGPVGQVRKLTKQEELSTPQIILLDISDNGGFYVSPATEVTEETINGFLDAYEAKSLDRMQLG